MIIDAFNRWSSNQALSAMIVGANNSTDVVDLGVGTTANPAIPSNAAGGGARDIGVGYPQKLLVQITATATSGGAATLSITIQGAPDDGTGNPGAYASWWTSPVYALATLNQGSRLMDMDFPRPPDGVAMPRFLRLLYTVGTAVFTGGTIFASLVVDRADYAYQGADNSIRGGYPPGIAIAN